MQVGRMVVGAPHRVTEWLRTSLATLGVVLCFPLDTCQRASGPHGQACVSMRIAVPWSLQVPGQSVDRQCGSSQQDAETDCPR